MKLFTWLPGRQKGAVYKKYCFMQLRIGRWGFDGYILKYKAGTFLPLHRDPVDGKMWRANITLCGISTFYCWTQILNWGWLHIFRADKEEHALRAWTELTKLSFGIAHFKKAKRCTHIWAGWGKCAGTLIYCPPNEPYSSEHYQCNVCDSTYNIQEFD